MMTLNSGCLITGRGWGMNRCQATTISYKKPVQCQKVHGHKGTHTYNGYTFQAIKRYNKMIEGCKKAISKASGAQCSLHMDCQ